MPMMGYSGPQGLGDSLAIIGAALRDASPGSAGTALPGVVQTQMGRQMYALQQQRLMAAADQLPENQRALALADPNGFFSAYFKNLEPQNMKQGETVAYGGPGGPQTTAPVMGIDNASGSAFTQTPDATTVTGQLGGDYDFTPGGLIGSKRTGGVAGRFSTPQTLAPGARLYGFTPSALQAGVSAAAPFSGVPQADPNAPAAPSMGIPQQGSAQLLAAGGAPRLLSPAEAAAGGFAPDSVVEQAADGTRSVKQPPQYGPEAKSSLRNQVLSSEEYKQAKAAMAAYEAMTANAKTMTGPSAYSMLDTFARAINPGAVARPTVIETIQKNLGLPAHLVGQLDSIKGGGNLTAEVRQQIIDAVVPFALSHWNQANALNQANAAIAKAHGFDAADVTAPLGSRPMKYSVRAADSGAPPPSARVVGKVYPSPRGPMQWTEGGWLPVH